MPQAELESKQSSNPGGLVSVLMPCFNHERYVVEALQSIARSSYGPLELIFIDDGSNDGSFGVAKKWLDQNASRFTRIVCERHATNQGIPATLNELVSHAAGRFIVFLASDDIMIADGIERQVVCALEQNVGFIFADATLIDESGNTISDSAIRYHGRNARRLSRRSCLIVDVLMNWEAPWPKIFISAEMAKRIGGFDESLLFEDRDFVVRALCDGSFWMLPEPTWGYRMRISNRLTPGLNALRMQHDYLRSEGMNFRRASGLTRLLLGLNILAGRVRFDESGEKKTSLIWPFFALIRRALFYVHLAAMR